MYFQRYHKIKAVMPEIKELTPLRYAQTAFISAYFIDFLNVHTLKAVGISTKLRFCVKNPISLAYEFIRGDESSIS